MILSIGTPRNRDLLILILLPVCAYCTWYVFLHCVSVMKYTYLLACLFRPLLPFGVEGVPESLPLLSILYCPFHLFPCYSVLSCLLLQPFLPCFPWSSSCPLSCFSCFIHSFNYSFVVHSISVTIPSELRSFNIFLY